MPGARQDGQRRHPTGGDAPRSWVVVIPQTCGRVTAASLCWSAPARLSWVQTVSIWALGWKRTPCSSSVLVTPSLEVGDAPWSGNSNGRCMFCTGPSAVMTHNHNSSDHKDVCSMCYETGGATWSFESTTCQYPGSGRYRSPSHVPALSAALSPTYIALFIPVNDPIPVGPCFQVEAETLCEL
jgi:hypothetical protein